MKTTARNLIMAFGIAAIGIAIALAGIYIGEKDDAPGGSLMGIVLMIGAMVLAVRVARRKA